jgi:hypothetical protein
MKPPRLRFTVRGMMIAVAVVSILFGGIVLSFRPVRPDCQLRVVNRSSQSISQLAVTVSGERVVIGDLADGASATVPYRSGNNHFSVEGALMDKTPVRERFRIAGDVPKGFSELIGRPVEVVGTVEPGGQFRLSLSR